MFPEIKVYVDGEEWIIESCDYRPEIPPIHFLHYDIDFEMTRVLPTTHHLTIRAMDPPWSVPKISKEEVVNGMAEMLKELE